MQLTERLALTAGLQYSQLALDRCMLSLYQKDMRLSSSTGGTMLTRNFFGDHATASGGGGGGGGSGPETSERAEKTQLQLRMFFGDLVGKISQHYLSLTRVKLPLRKAIVYAYQQQRDSVGEGRKAADRSQALRALKLSLVSKYCDDIVAEVRPYLLKAQINL